MGTGSLMGTHKARLRYNFIFVVGGFYVEGMGTFKSESFSGGVEEFLFNFGGFPGGNFRSREITIYRRIGQLNINWQNIFVHVL